MHRRRFVLAATSALAAPSGRPCPGNAQKRQGRLSAGDAQPRPGAALEHRLPARRQDADHRAAGPAARLRQRPAGAQGAVGRAPGPDGRPGRPARCLPAPQLRAEPRALSFLCRGRRQRHGDHRRPRRAGRGRPRQRQGDLRGPAAWPGQPQSRLAHRLRPRRADVCQHRRPLPDAARAGSRRFRRQDRAPARRRLGAAGQSLRRQGRCAAGDLHLGQPQSAGPRAAIPRPAGSGRSSTGPRAATNSTS